MLNKFSKLVGYIQYQYEEFSKYLKSSKSIARIKDKNRLLKSRKVPLPAKLERQEQE